MPIAGLYLQNVCVGEEEDRAWPIMELDSVLLLPSTGGDSFKFFMFDTIESIHKL